MLILTRKTSQGIVLSGNVIVRILAVDGERVKLGIDAPRSVQVLREELITNPRPAPNDTDGADVGGAASTTPSAPAQRAS